MSLYDYNVSRKIEARDEPFYALIMVAMRKADDTNLEKLKSAFRKVWEELVERYNSQGGKLPNE